MSADPRYQAALALHRFGLGPRMGTVPGSIAAVASDPRGALLAELDKPSVGQIFDSNPMTAATSATAAFNFPEARKAAEIAQKMADQAKAEAMAMANAMEAPAMEAAKSMEAQPAEPPKPAQPNAPAQAARPNQPQEPTIQ